MKLRHWRKLGREDGNSLVEMALISCFVFLPMLIGIFEVSYGMYAYTYVSSAARQATRYAAVRGAESCVIAPGFPNCNLSPSGGSYPTTASGSAALLSYVQSLQYPGLYAGNVGVTATWLSADTSTGTAPAFSTTVWDTPCSATDLNGASCNSVGDAVQVTVTYKLNMPVWKTAAFTVSSTSQMMINE